MKLRNKKTGEIGYLITGKDSDNYLVINDDWLSCGVYSSLTELNEEWADVPEEPSKIIWQIKDSGELQDFEEDAFSDGYIESSKSIGNYFDIREEAEKAVEKLKAFKRLKANGFKFTEWGVGFDKTLVIKAKYTRGQIYDDMNLLFGGEE